MSAAAPMTRVAASKPRRLPDPLSLAAAVAAVGVMIVELGYSIGRDAGTGGTVCFWLGQGLIWVPLMLVAASGHATRSARLAAVMLFAVAQSVVKWLYSPLDFRFPDELAHQTTAEAILRTRHLYEANTVLPVSPKFPGLEIVTSALVSTAHLSVFTAGTIVVSVCHVAFAALLFTIFCAVLRNQRVAAIAAMIFALNPHHAFFNALFIYEVPALLFAGATLVLSMRRESPARSVALPGLLCVSALTATHHVTALVLVGSTLLCAVVCLVVRDREMALRLGAVTLAASATLSIWMAVVAPDTLHYLWSSSLNSSSRGATHWKGPATSPEPATLERAVSYLAVVVACALNGLGMLVLFRAHARNRSRGNGLLIAFAIAGLMLFVVLALRVVTGKAELTGRALTYVFLFSAVPMAVAWNLGLRECRVRLAFKMGLYAALAAMLAGFMMLGWPAFWERLPGRFHVDAFESGVDAHGLAAARWTAVGLPHGARIACDTSGCNLLAAYGGHVPAANMSSVFYAPTITPAARGLLAYKHIRYVYVDERMTQQVPLTGSYFAPDSHAGQHVRPLAPALLAKFDKAKEANRVYDDGTIRIYDVAPRR